MFKFISPITFAVLFLFVITSCTSGKNQFVLSTPHKTQLNKTEIIRLKQVQGEAPDSIQLFFADKQILLSNNSAEISTSDFGTGKYQVTALAFYPNQVVKTTDYVEIFSDKKPAVYSFKIVNEFPHDSKAFTQGLEFYNGFLYETTGRNGESWLRKVDYKTGKVLQQADLDKKYFGEGMTIMNDKVYWLTWQFGKGFIFNLNDFKQEGEFRYKNSLEGWGLTHNDTHIIKTDGSRNIWFLNPTNLEEGFSIQAYTNSVALKMLNEIEWIEGKIYANYWQKPLIAIINPKSGVVEAIIDLTKLTQKIQGEQMLDENDDVLNGIAYDSANKRIFVTGKHWNKLYEIEIVK